MVGWRRPMTGDHAGMSGHDHVVAASVERFGRAAPNSQAATGDKEGVAWRVHVVLLCLGLP